MTVQRKDRARGLVLALLVSASLPAAAGPPKVESEDPRVLYLEGESEFDLGHYREALALFEKAYKKKHVPGLLYNIAQCHRRLGELKDALATYRTFLIKDPKNPVAARARETIEELERALTAQASARVAPPGGLAPSPVNPADAQAAAAAPPGDGEAAGAKPPPASEQGRTRSDPPSLAAAAIPLEPPSPPPAAAPPPADRPRVPAAAPPPAGSGKAGGGASAPAPVPLAVRATAEVPVPPPPGPTRTWTWVAAGGAALALGGGVLFGISAASTKSEFESQVATRAQKDELAALYDQKKARANALLVAGGVLAAAAGALFILRF